MNYEAEIEATRERIKRCKHSVEAQRWRVAALEGSDSAKWLAEQLLAASEDRLGAHRARLEVLLKAKAKAETEDKIGGA